MDFSSVPARILGNVFFVMHTIRDSLIQKHGGADLRTLTMPENDVSVSIPSPSGNQSDIQETAVEAFEFLSKRKVVKNFRFISPSGRNYRPTNSRGEPVGLIYDLSSFSLSELPVVSNVDIPNIRLFQKLFESIEREWERRNKKAGKPVGTTPSFTLANQPVKTTRKKRIPSSKILFPKGTKWDQLTFLFVSEDTVTISGAGETFSKAFYDMGFRDNRKTDNYPCEAWTMLRIFGLSNGEIFWTDYVNAKTNCKTELKKRVSQLRRKLKEKFNILGDPFKPARKNKVYRTKFRVLVSSDELKEDEPQDKDGDSYKEMAGRYENLPGVKKAKYFDDNPSPEDD